MPSSPARSPFVSWLLLSAVQLVLLGGAVPLRAPVEGDEACACAESHYKHESPAERSRLQAADGATRRMAAVPPSIAAAVHATIVPVTVAIPAAVVHGAPNGALARLPLSRAPPARD